MFMITSREFHLAHRDLSIPMGSWAAVEPNGTGLPSREKSAGLRALLPSPFMARRKPHYGRLFQAITASAMLQRA